MANVNTDDDCYDMNPEKCRFALIISNEKFDVNIDFSEDVKNMKTALEKLGFVYETRPDLKAEEMKELFEKEKRDYSKYSCFLYVILSHGCANNGIYGIDWESVTYKDMISPLHKCNELSDKPKLLFIKACRGNLHDDGNKQKKNIECEDIESEDIEGFQIPTYPDVLVAAATVPGLVAYVDSFIKPLSDVLIKYGEKHHLLEMLTKVNSDLAYKNDWWKQQSCVQSTLTKKLYFPGKED